MAYTETEMVNVKQTGKAKVTFEDYIKKLKDVSGTGTNFYRDKIYVTSASTTTGWDGGVNVFFEIGTKHYWKGAVAGSIDWADTSDISSNINFSYEYVNTNGDPGVLLIHTSDRKPVIEGDIGTFPDDLVGPNSTTMASGYEWGAVQFGPYDGNPDGYKEFSGWDSDKLWKISDNLNYGKATFNVPSGQNVVNFRIKWSSYWGSGTVIIVGDNDPGTIESDKNVSDLINSDWSGYDSRINDIEWPETSSKYLFTKFDFGDTTGSEEVTDTGLIAVGSNTKFHIYYFSYHYGNGTDEGWSQWKIYSLKDSTAPTNIDFKITPSLTTVDYANNIIGGNFTFDIYAEDETDEPTFPLKWEIEKDSTFHSNGTVSNGTTYTTSSLVRDNLDETSGNTFSLEVEDPWGNSVTHGTTLTLKKSATPFGSFSGTSSDSSTGSGTTPTSSGTGTASLGSTTVSSVTVSSTSFTAPDKHNLQS